MRKFFAALLMGVACLALMADTAEARGCRGGGRFFNRGSGGCGSCNSGGGILFHRHASTACATCGSTTCQGGVCNVGGIAGIQQEITATQQPQQLIRINGQLYRLVPQDQAPVPTRKTTP